MIIRVGDHAAACVQVSMFLCRLIVLPQFVAFQAYAQILFMTPAFFYAEAEDVDEA